MACTLSNKCAKNLSKRTVLLQLIIKNVVTCFFGTQCRFPIGGGGGGMSYSLHHVKGGNCPSGENVRGNMSGQTA